MNYTEFLENLDSSGFKVKGKSFAFKAFGEWSLAFIRLGGRFQRPGKVCFVFCARPQGAKGLEGEIASESKNPHDYPFKLIQSEIGEKLNYKTKVNYKTEYLDMNADWSNIYNVLLNDLPEQLDKLGVMGLEKQLRAINNPIYAERIWLGENVEIK